MVPVFVEVTICDLASEINASINVNCIAEIVDMGGNPEQCTITIVGDSRNFVVDESRASLVAKIRRAVREASSP